MVAELKAGIVRILTPDGATAGTGFVVSDEGLIATCAHVVWTAEARKEGLPRPDVVEVVFHTTGDVGKAQVVEKWWCHPDAEDVAILRLKGMLTKGVTPLPLGSSEHSKDHDFRSWGYRHFADFPQGLPAQGKIQDRTGCGTQAAVVLLTNQIDKAMSGAPLWDIQGRRVVGM